MKRRAAHLRLIFKSPSSLLSNFSRSAFAIPEISPRPCGGGASISHHFSQINLLNSARILENRSLSFCFRLRKVRKLRIETFPALFSISLLYPKTTSTSPDLLVRNFISMGVLVLILEWFPSRSPTTVVPLRPVPPTKTGMTLELIG